MTVLLIFACFAFFFVLGRMSLQSERRACCESRAQRSETALAVCSQVGAKLYPIGVTVLFAGLVALLFEQSGVDAVEPPGAPQPPVAVHEYREWVAEVGLRLTMLGTLLSILGAMLSGASLPAKVRQRSLMALGVVLIATSSMWLYWALDNPYVQ